MTAFTYDSDSSDPLATIRALASRLGKALLEKALLAYYVAIDPETPAWARSALIAALAYLGLPFDGLPDPTPIVGFSDDLAVLIGALAAVAVCVRIRHIRLARARMRAWGIRVEDVANDREDGDPWRD